MGTRDSDKRPAIYNTVIDKLRKVLTKEEWVSFFDKLKGDEEREFFSKVAEKVAVIAPEDFETVCKKCGDPMPADVYYTMKEKCVDCREEEQTRP